MHVRVLRCDGLLDDGRRRRDPATTRVDVLSGTAYGIGPGGKTSATEYDHRYALIGVESGDVCLVTEEEQWHFAQGDAVASVDGDDLYAGSPPLHAWQKMRGRKATPDANTPQPATLSPRRSPGRVRAPA